MNIFLSLIIPIVAASTSFKLVNSKALSANESANTCINCDELNRESDGNSPCNDCGPCKSGYQAYSMQTTCQLPLKSIDYNTGSTSTIAVFVVIIMVFLICAMAVWLKIIITRSGNRWFFDLKTALGEPEPDQ